MHRFSRVFRSAGWLRFAAVAALFGSAIAAAQVPVDEAGDPLAPIDSYAQDGEAVADDEIRPLGSGELEELIGPIALYPDDLLAIVLPASTYPLEIVQAARFLERYENDSTVEPDTDWDESVVALLNYPEVIEMLNEDIDWTWRLGEAVVRQQQDVIAAVESFRDRAYVAGNLQSDQYQQVTRDEGVIEITPIEEDIIYVPYYEPQHVLVSQVRPVYHYYPRAYPVYYYPYPYGHSFTTRNFWGVTTAFRIGWATDYLRVHHRSYWGHPYYGRRYHAYNYRSPSIKVYNDTYVNHRSRRSSSRERDGDYWSPRGDRRARPANYRSTTQSYRRTSTNPVEFRDRRHDSATSRRYTSTTPRGQTSATPGRRTSTISTTPTTRARDPQARDLRRSGSASRPVSRQRNVVVKTSAVRQSSRRAQRPASSQAASQGSQRVATSVTKGSTGRGSPRRSQRKR
jgi:hypothetical protein